MSLIGLIAGIVLIVIGGGLMYPGYQKLMLAMDSKSWPSVQGSITDSRKQKHAGDEDSGPYWVVTVDYRYEVEGHAYNHSFSYNTSKKGAKHAVKGSNAPGTPITVYYDPANPFKAVLTPGVQWTDFLLLIIATVLILIGLGVMFGR